MASEEVREWLRTSGGDLCSALPKGVRGEAQDVDPTMLLYLITR
jgi:hypothetical protein